jgi:hypothetical protein
MGNTPIRRTILAAGISLGLAAGSGAQAGLINGGFETTLVPVPPNGFIITNQANVPGWRTTSSDGDIEIWDSGFSGFGSPGFPVLAYEGQQFAEINATQFATLFQDSAGIAAGSIVGFQFAHRGRGGVDVMRLMITDLGGNNVLGGGDDTLLFSRDYADGNLAWGFYTSAGEPTITALGNTIRFAYQAVSTASGNSTVGNFIDAADFGVGVGRAAPEPATALLVGLGLALFGRRMFSIRPGAA